MVARRRNQDKGQTEYERVKAMLDALPESDEDPALFWGPNWEQELEEAEAEIRDGCVEVFLSGEEFLAALKRISKDQ